MFFFLPFPPGDAVIGRLIGGDGDIQPVFPERFTKKVLSIKNGARPTRTSRMSHL